MSYGSGGVPRQQKWRPNMAAKFDFIKLIGKMLKLKIVFARVVKYDIIKHFFAFGSILSVFVIKIKGARRAISLIRKYIR